MKEPDDGDEEVDLWMRQIDNVLRELLADPRFKGHQVHKFTLVQDEDGNRVFGDGFASVSFQLHAHLIGANDAPVSVVFFLDGTLLGRSTTIRPVFGENA